MRHTVCLLLRLDSVLKYLLLLTNMLQLLPEKASVAGTAAVIQAMAEVTAILRFLVNVNKLTKGLETSLSTIAESQGSVSSIEGGDKLADPP